MNPERPENFDNEPGGEYDAALEAYLDNALSADDRAAFEARLGADDRLRDLVATSRAADEALRRLYKPPRAGVAGRIGPRRRWLFGGAAAAALVLIGVAVVLLLPSRPERPTPATVYFRLVSEGYTPQWRCDNDEEFALAVVRRLGQPLLIAEAPGLEVLGWAYADRYSGGTISAQTMVLMTRYKGEPVLAMIDRVELDREVELPDQKKLRIFRRTFQNLVVWEITPFDRPATLQHFFVP